MSSEKSKTMEEQLCFSSLIWSAVRLVDYPRRSCLSKPPSSSARSIRSKHPTTCTSHFVWPKKSRFFSSEFICGKCIHVFDHLAASTKMIFLDKFLQIFRRFNRTSGFRFVSSIERETTTISKEKRIGPRFYLFLFFVTFHFAIIPRDRKYDRAYRTGLIFFFFFLLQLYRIVKRELRFVKNCLSIDLFYRYYIVQLSV